MITRSRAGLVWRAAAVPLLACASGCQSKGDATPAAKPAPPAKVEGAPKEADLATVTLTAEAETRLGLVTVKAEKKAVPRSVLYAGEVVVPPGRLLNVTAPFVGEVKAAEGSKALPLPGDVVKEGQAVCVLVPILSPESRATLLPLLIQAEGQVKQANEQQNIAKVALNRAENLVRDRLGGAGTLVDARAQYELAATNLKNAEANRAAIAAVAGEGGAGSPIAQTITAPASGTVQNVHATPGQKVAAGAALFELAVLDPLWVKVPVYVGEASRVAPGRPAEVGGVSESGAADAVPPRPGKPVSAPPSGDPLAATIHLFYEVANKDGAIRPGERVGVTLPLKGSAETLTVPRASIIRDYHGGAWVYEKIADHKYARRRVLVERTSGDLALLVYGPKPGASVVTDGSAELYGAEFGGK